MEQQIALVLMILMIVLLCATPVLSAEPSMTNGLVVYDDITFVDSSVSEILA